MIDQRAIVLDTWAGRRYYAVEVIGETPKKVRVRILTQGGVMLPCRQQCDRMIPETAQGGGFVITVWTRGGEKLRSPGKYRTVDAIPCLQPWKEQ